MKAAMKNVFIIVLVLGGFPALCQYIFESNPGGGSWNSPSTWRCMDELGIDCTGASVPGANDIALISSNSSTAITVSGNISIGDIYVMNDVAQNKIRRPTALSAANITINGQLVGISPDLFDLIEPSNAIFENSGNLTLTFNGANGLDPVIMVWGHNAPLPRVNFSPTGTITVESFSIRQPATIQSGTVVVGIGHEIRDFSGTAILAISENATLDVKGSFDNNPPTFNLDPLSTVIYSANAAQNIYPTTYGNLSLTSSSAVTKTLSGSGLTIRGNLTIGTNVTFSPSSQVDFTGGVLSQSISGGGTLNFAGGIGVNKSSGTVTLNKSVSASGITVIEGTLDLGDVTTTLSNAAVSNSDIITSGANGSLQVEGTSTFSGSGSTTLNHLTISSGSTNFNKSVALTGNLVNNGSLSFSSTVTVTFTDGNSQSISGNAMTIGHIVIDKPSSMLTNNTAVRLTGVLTVTTGTFDADGSGGGNFILNSDTNGDAAIGPMGGGSIIGEVTFERYFNNTQKDRWRNLAFPVTSVTYAELGASIELQTNSLAVYTESVLGNVDQGWSYVTGGTLNSRRGHTAWMYNEEPITISVRGPLLQNVPALESPYNFGVTYTDDPGQPASEDGWNFVPNPFASPIGWDNPGWVKVNVNSQIAVWDASEYMYRYTGVDWDGVIAQGQAFWIQTNASNPLLTCKESVKEAVSDPTFYRTKASEIPSRLVISLNSDLHTDKAVVHFNEKALAEFDSEFDAYKLKNLIFNLSTLTNEGANLAVNVLPKSSCTSSIRLNITNIDPGTYALSFEGLGSFDNLRSMVLTDNFTGKSEKISESTVYSFEVTSDGKSFGAERFSLGFDFSDAKAQPVVTKEGSKLTSDYDEGNQWLVNGKVIPGATGKSIIPGQPGLYQVQVNDGSCLLVSESLSVKESVSRIYPNPATDEIKVDLFGLLEDSYETEGDIYLYSMNGELIRKEVFSKGDDIKAVKLDGVKPGVYMINLVTNKSNVIFRERIVIR
jgi:hypothetical protein